MTKTHEMKPSVWAGAVVGLLLMPPLMAMAYLGSTYAGLPFPPLDMFSFLIQTLPGGLVTFGLDTMVNLLIALGFGENLDTVGKLAEQTLGVLTFWALGIAVSAAFFGLLNRLQEERDTGYIPGALFGLLFGLPMLYFSLTYNISATAPVTVQVIWVLMLFIGYGIFNGWAYNILYLQKTADAPEATVEGVDRRQFLVRLGGATATITVIGAGLGAFFNQEPGEGTPIASSDTSDSAASSDAASSDDTAPNADASIEPAPGTRPEVTPVEDHYRIDIATGLPSIPDDYTLPITGLVANEVDWTLDEIREMPAMTEYITQGCISNRIGGSLISTVEWTGVSFQHILDQLDPDDNAEALFIKGYDNFDEYIPLEMIREDERIMLAYDFDGEPLPLRNGYPLRVHIPDRYGMKQPKWIDFIEVVDEHKQGYWVRRGWSARAEVRTTSVIDTVATDAIYEDDSGSFRVPVGGIAWSGDKGISKVEVRVNDGDWQEAQLREALSDRTWVLWRYDWTFEEGATQFEVRTFDGEGNMQVLESSGVRPDGATGISAMNEFMRDSMLPGNAEATETPQEA